MEVCYVDGSSVTWIVNLFFPHNRNDIFFRGKSMKKDEETDFRCLNLNGFSSNSQRPLH